MATLRDETYGEITYHAAYEPTRSVRTERYLYIRRFHPQTTPVGPNLSACRLKDHLRANGLFECEIPREEFYDLLFDPQERVNLASDASRREVLENFRNRLERRMRESDDPLLEGPVPIRDGCRIFPMELREEIAGHPGVAADDWNSAIPWAGFCEEVLRKS